VQFLGRTSSATLREGAFLGEEWATLGLGQNRAIHHLRDVGTVLGLGQDRALGVAEGWASAFGLKKNKETN
jgi:hypothetical protein